MSVEEMAAFIKVDSLAFLSIDGLYRAVGEAERDSAAPQFCDACFTGDYPTRLDRPRTPPTTSAPSRALAGAGLNRMASLDGRIAVVTGASRGIGRRRRWRLAAAGAHVIAVARTVGGLEELDDAIRAKGGSATLVPLDLKDLAGIDRLGAVDLRALGQARHALRQCRRARRDHAARASRAEGLGRRDGGQRHRQLAPDPLARSAAAPLRRRARAVRDSAASPGRCRPYWGAYSATKAALEALVRTYAAEIAKTNVRANLFNPGPLRTQHARHRRCRARIRTHSLKPRGGGAGHRPHAVARLHRERRSLRFRDRRDDAASPEVSHSLRRLRPS